MNTPVKTDVVIDTCYNRDKNHVLKPSLNVFG